jgi:hypothetical protein
MYAYSQNGILLSRYVFKKEVIKYGEPIRTSSDGQNFIFKKSTAQRRETVAKNDKELRKNEPWIYNVMTLSMYGVRFIKKIDIKKQFLSLNKKQNNWFAEWIKREIGGEQKMPKFKF